MTDNSEISFRKVIAAPFTPMVLVKDATPARLNLVFCNTNGDQVAELTEQEDGTLHFEGDATEAAEIFFASVIAVRSERVSAAEKEISRLRNEISEIVELPSGDLQGSSIRERYPTFKGRTWEEVING